MSSTKYGLGSMIATLVLSFSPAIQAVPLTDSPQVVRPADSDVIFLRKAAEAGAYEIEASKVAQSKASTLAVKTFASQMVRDHEAADKDLMLLAQKVGVQLPASPSAEKMQEINQLERLSGAAFDKAYVQNVGIDGHQDTVALFRKASDNAKNDRISAFAKKTLPTVTHHLEMARKLAREVGMGQ